MPSRKKKYNARFPAGRIKKIMQMDDDVGKIAHAVPVVISRSVELFVNSLLQQTAAITRERNAKTLSLTHTKHCILKEQKFDFLKDLVKNIDDVSAEDEKKTSRSNSNAPMSSQSESLDKSFEVVRRRIKSETHFDASLSTPPNGDSKPIKRRYSSTDRNSGIPDAKKFSESQSTSYANLTPSYTNDICLDEQSKSESFSSCDLIIDEDSET